MKIRYYFHTLRYMRVVQVVNRIMRKIARFKNTKVPAIDLARSKKHWEVCRLNPQSLFENNQCRFLNHEGDALDWFPQDQNKLWLYNLHYFDDLTAQNASLREDVHHQRITHWIAHNPAPVGDGWEPYPQSLRIVNWVKFQLNGASLNNEALESLALQAHVLSQDLEYHILGNHLFANAKALIFAGCFFDGAAADKWLQTGLGILRKEINEQVLDDGGNFELTPMYHAIMLVDVLDLLNVLRAFASSSHSDDISLLTRYAGRMLRWLDTMSLGDGKISFFNDSVFGIAPSNSQIHEYAKSLNISVDHAASLTIEPAYWDLSQSGYAVAKSSELALIADLARIGPDYIPGHAHADSLSFEMSLFQQRVFVNSGIDRYGVCEERLRQRKTAAHNTVSVNGMDSSEVWSGFRVARRAKIEGRRVKCEKGVIYFEACHNGFKAQGVNCIHHRKFVVRSNEVCIIDDLRGGFDNAQAFFHLHPSVSIGNVSSSSVELFVNDHRAEFVVSGGLIAIEDSVYCPEFGIKQASHKIVVSFDGSKVETRVRWL
ncbi:Heparin-sulfate lyase [BD1-7 clade bacterium]|uniref:Heparin-sulfate lyase n=1 Tax=BD1-7 clade bacterium TaxID=2029982 RepID=A0A5S9QNN1_9GAMM|nr:Heparin-sulfate lyase [BD1-7 clade bacterium]CAA0121484.1 Heparin-sulfate lyase [BD1-7 clade bacterium]